MSENERRRELVQKARGWFLEFRIIPVLLWSFTSVGLGTALAFSEHVTFDPGLLATALSWVAVAALSAHALVCTAMLVMPHYMDAPADAAATPPKQTTVVFLGPTGARAYATFLAVGAAALHGALGLLVNPVFAMGTICALPAIVAHARVRPWDLVSVTRNELRVIQLGIAAGLAVAVVLAPFLWPILPMAAFGYVAHLVVAAPPAELARAWLAGPRRRAEDANSAGPLSEP